MLPNALSPGIWVRLVTLKFGKHPAVMLSLSQAAAPAHPRTPGMSLLPVRQSYLRDTPRLGCKRWAATLSTTGSGPNDQHGRARPAEDVASRLQQHPGHPDACSATAELHSSRPVPHNSHTHSHGGLEAAEHQLAHRAVEKTGFKFLESVAERLSSKQLMQKLSSQVLGKAGERLGERIGERAGERLTERLGESVAERVGERVAQRAGERVSERITERMGERVVERVGEAVASRVGEHTAASALGHTAASGGVHAAQQLGTHMAGRIATRTVGQAADKATEVTAGHALGNMTAGHAAPVAKALDHALDKVLGSRFGRRFLSPAILARLGRGAMVALPALGALFVAHLAHQDYHRLREERASGRSLAVAGFAVAFICDLADVAAHALVVMGLLHNHFQVGLYIPHALLHLAESGGLVLAVISTLAAAGAELLAMRRGLMPKSSEGMAAPVAGPIKEGHEQASRQHQHQHQQ